MDYNAEASVTHCYLDKDINDLCRKKEELEREISVINAQIAAKQIDVSSLLKKNVWYVYSGGLNLIYFKFTDADFVRDEELWLHTYIEERICKTGTWYHTGAFYRFPLNLLGVAYKGLKEASEDSVKNVIKNLDAHVKAMSQDLKAEENVCTVTDLCKNSKLFQAFVDMYSYNYSTDALRVIYNRAVEEYESHDTFEVVTISINDVDDDWYDNEGLNFVWGMLTLMFGEYGSSPRVGWLIVSKELIDFLENMLKNLDE